MSEYLPPFELEDSEKFAAAINRKPFLKQIRELLQKLNPNNRSWDLPVKIKSVVQPRQEIEK